MSCRLIIGAGIIGVYNCIMNLSQLGYQVRVVDRHLFPAMETSLLMVDYCSHAMPKFVEPKIDSAERHEMDVSKFCPLLLNPAFFMLQKYARLMECSWAILNIIEANTPRNSPLALLLLTSFEVAENSYLF